MVASLIASTIFVFAFYIVGAIVLDALGNILKQWIKSVFTTR